MDALKKILYLILVLLWAGGVASGLIICLSAKAYVPSLSILVLGALSYPTVKRLVKAITGD